MMWCDPCTHAIKFCVAVTLLLARCQVHAQEDSWPTCESRAYRDDEVEPGGLKLLGVKESPLGAFPLVPAGTTHEHFFQQLREVWEDDCPRIAVQIGLQPAPGRLRNWTSAALWAQHFNHSGIIMVVDPIKDYLHHFEDGFRTSPHGLLLAKDRLTVKTVKSLLAAESGRKKKKERTVSFDSPEGGQVLAGDDAMSKCANGASGPEATDPGHPCARVLERMQLPEPLEYTAPVATFDEIWHRDLLGRHVDFLQVDLGARNMPRMLQKGFSKIFGERQVSILVYRVDSFWTKAELKRVVEWLDAFDYFSMFKRLCPDSSQAGTFSYKSPRHLAGPTTYLPISGLDFDKIVDWEHMPLPQDVFAFDLRQPDIFKTVQLGDVHCDADDTEDTCSKDSSGQCRADSAADAQPPVEPKELKVVHSESRSMTLEWRGELDGAKPQSYALRIDPGAKEETFEHDVYDVVSGSHIRILRDLQPDTEYTISLQAVGLAGRSTAAVVVHHTEREEAAGGDYKVAKELHCGMGSSEEVTPAGPPPQGTSFFPGTADVNSCRARCDDNQQCVAFQLKEREACWLYQRQPDEARMTGARLDAGWWCGVRHAPRR